MKYVENLLLKIDYFCVSRWNIVINYDILFRETSFPIQAHFYKKLHFDVSKAYRNLLTFSSRKHFEHYNINLNSNSKWNIDFQ